MISGYVRHERIGPFTQTPKGGHAVAIRPMLAGQEMGEPVGVAAWLPPGDFHGRELDVEQLQVVDQPVLEAAVAEPRPQRQWMGVRGFDRRPRADR